MHAVHDWSCKATIDISVFLTFMPLMWGGLLFKSKQISDASMCPCRNGRRAAHWDILVYTIEAFGHSIRKVRLRLRPHAIFSYYDVDAVIMPGAT